MLNFFSPIELLSLSSKSCNEYGTSAIVPRNSRGLRNTLWKPLGKTYFSPSVTGYRRPVVEMELFFALDFTRTTRFDVSYTTHVNRTNHDIGYDNIDG